MGVYKNIKNIDNSLIIERDKECVLCGAKYNLQVHEIKPRSMFGSKTIHLCFIPENRITLCAQCHSIAHTRRIRQQLNEIQKRKKEQQNGKC